MELQTEVYQHFFIPRLMNQLSFIYFIFLMFFMKFSSQSVCLVETGSVVYRLLNYST